ncbi:MAG: hypothetical protein JSS99_05510 [Actinobacteria bacterium]|nr:hypothetical protein [Actinomycetota bacterium]
MPRRLAVPAFLLGCACALALAACGGDKSAATVAAPPIASDTTTSPTTATVVTTTAPTTTAPAATSTTPTALSTTPTTSSHASGGATTTQPSGGAPAGCPNAVGGFIRDLRASDCGVARTVASAWFAAVHGGAAPDSTIQAGGYSCSATLAGERASVTCSGDSGPVAFTASP